MSESENWEKSFAVRREETLKLDALAEQYVKLRDNLPEVLTKDAFLELEAVRLGMEHSYCVLTGMERQEILALVENLQAQIEIQEVKFKAFVRDMLVSSKRYLGQGK